MNTSEREEAFKGLFREENEYSKKSATEQGGLATEWLAEGKLDGDDVMNILQGIVDKSTLDPFKVAATAMLKDPETWKNDYYAKSGNTCASFDSASAPYTEEYKKEYLKCLTDKKYADFRDDWCVSGFREIDVIQATLNTFVNLQCPDSSDEDKVNFKDLTRGNGTDFENLPKSDNLSIDLAQLKTSCRIATAERLLQHHRLSFEGLTKGGFDYQLKGEAFTKMALESTYENYLKAHLMDCFHRNGLDQGEDSHADVTITLVAQAMTLANRKEEIPLESLWNFKEDSFKGDSNKRDIWKSNAISFWSFAAPGDKYVVIQLSKIGPKGQQVQ